VILGRIMMWCQLLFSPVVMLSWGGAAVFCLKRRIDDIMSGESTNQSINQSIENEEAKMTNEGSTDRIRTKKAAVTRTVYNCRDYANAVVARRPLGVERGWSAWDLANSNCRTSQENCLANPGKVFQIGVTPNYVCEYCAGHLVPNGDMSACICPGGDTVVETSSGQCQDCAIEEKIPNTARDACESCSAPKVAQGVSCVGICGTFFRDDCKCAAGKAPKPGHEVLGLPFNSDMGRAMLCA
jgi:hypothetical protein